MKLKTEKRLYTESGLPNVWIRCARVKDDAGEDAIIIPNINLQHKEIAKKIVTSAHALTGPELRFLRTEMGMTQAQLGERVQQKCLTIACWEKEESPLDGDAEKLVRKLAFRKLKLSTSVLHIRSWLPKRRDCAISEDLSSVVAA